MIRKTPSLRETDVDGATRAAEKVVLTHQRLASFLRAGVTVAQVDREVARILADLRCKSCFLGYKVPRTPAFPSHACLSVNDCVVHGTAATHTRPLEEGDVISVDIGVRSEGWIGDAAWTYAIGSQSDEARALMACGRESLRRGIETLRPGNTYMRWAEVVQRYVEEECGFHLTRGLGGHGYGRKLHAPPFVSNVVAAYPGEWPDAFTPCLPGTLVAVEPMISVGTGRTRQEPGTWPIYSADGSLSVHYEADVLITEDGPRNLTEAMNCLPDVVG